jgi:hypothetical protein
MSRGRLTLGVYSPKFRIGPLHMQHIRQRHISFRRVLFSSSRVGVDEHGFYTDIRKQLFLSVLEIPCDLPCEFFHPRIEQREVSKAR